MPAHGHHGRRIVVGVDGSESSKDALRWAAHQAELTGASVEAVITWEITPNSYGVAIPLPSDYDPAAIAKQTLDETILHVLGESGAAPCACPGRRRFAGTLASRHSQGRRPAGPG